MVADLGVLDGEAAFVVGGFYGSPRLGIAADLGVAGSDACLEMLADAAGVGELVGPTRAAFGGGPVVGFENR